MKLLTNTTMALLCSVALAAAGCTGDAGEPGAAGQAGEQGPPGEQGPAGPAGPGDISEFQLPGENFFPEGIALADNGVLFVGSLFTGDIVAFEAAGADPDHAQLLDLPADAIAGGAVGMLLIEDAAAGTRTLAVCDSSTDLANAKAAQVVQIDVSDLANPTVVSTNALTTEVGADVLCNDVAADSAGNLYATDSIGGQVQQIAAGAAVDADATVWKADALLQSTDPQNPFGANGITVLGDGTNEFVFVVNLADGTLSRIAINAADGAAGEIVEVPLKNNLDENILLRGPDGLKTLDSDTLLLIENSGNSLTRIDLADAFGPAPTGKATVLSSRLDAPTTLAIDGTSVLVVEGQLDDLLDPNQGEAALPFRVVRVQLY